jgi:hypothetical protein
MGLMELGALERRLSDLLGAPVDLIPSAALRPDLRDRVLAQAVPLVTRQPEESLGDARTHFALMRQHARGNLDDRLVIDAVCMRLSAGVEALSGLDAATRDRLFGESLAGREPVLSGRDCEEDQ